MNGDPEIKELLREIRDLHKAHFERYKEFTARITQAEALRAEEENRARRQLEADRREQEAYRREMQQAVRSARVQSTVATVLVVLLLGLAIGVPFLSWIVWHFVSPLHIAP